MGVQSFNSSVNSSSFSFNSTTTAPKIDSFNLTNIQPQTFTPTINTPKVETVGFTSMLQQEDSQFESFAKTAAADFIQVSAHVVTGFTSVFEQIADGAITVAGEIVILRAKTFNFVSGLVLGKDAPKIDTDTMEQNLMDVVATDWSKTLIADKVDNWSFVQENANVSDAVLTGAEVVGSVAGNAVLYTVAPGSAVGIGLSVANGVGKGFSKAANSGATFEQATASAAVYGAISGVAKFGVDKVGAAAAATMKAGSHTATSFVGKVTDTVATTGKELGTSFAIGASGSLAKNVSNYAIYEKNATDDNGNLKYGSYGQYFNKSGAAIDAVASGASSAISVGFKAYNTSYAEKPQGTSEELLKQAKKYGMKEPVGSTKAIVKAVKHTVQDLHDGQQQLSPSGTAAPVISHFTHKH